VNRLARMVELGLSPFGIIVVLLAAGVLLSLTRRRRRAGFGLLFLGAALYLLCTATPLAELAIGNLERPYLPLQTVDPSSGVDRIVILSGYGVDHPATPVTSNLAGETTCRVAEGIRLYRQLPKSKIVVSGGILRKGDQPIARQMADFIVAMGISPDDVLVEGRSRNTYENLVEVQPIVGSNPFILVTSACHLRRAMAIAHKLGMRPVAAPACIWTLQQFPPGIPWSTWTFKVVKSFACPSVARLGALQLAYHEYVGFVWYRLLGRL
jgi:uncharacterized SAM-binding protein YcdF (DUF218 family)